MTRTFFEEDPTRVVEQRAVGHYKRVGDAWHLWRPTAYFVGGAALGHAWKTSAAGTRTSRTTVCRKGNISTNSSGRARSWGIALSSIWTPPSRKTIPRRGESPPGQYRGLRRRQFTGGAWGINAAMSQFPDQEFTVICLSNNDDIASWKMNQRIADLALGDRLGPRASRTPAPAASELPAVELKEADLRDKVGAYRMKGTGFIWRITASGRNAPVDGPLPGDLSSPALERHRFRSRGPGVFSQHPARLLASPRPARRGLSRRSGMSRKTREDATSRRSNRPIRPRTSSRNTPAGTRAMSSRRPIGWRFATGGSGCA